MKKIICIILLFSTCIFSQGRIIRSDEFNALRDSIQTWTETLALLGYVTPESYGADGTGLTDASTELNLALAEAGANGYTLLALGTYKIHGHISVPANTKIDGKGVGVIKGDSDSLWTTRYAKTGLWLEGSNITIENLTIDSTHIIFQPGTIKNVTIRNCTFENLNSTSWYGSIIALYYGMTTPTYLENIVVENSYFTNNLGSGIMINPDSCKNITIKNNRFEDIHNIDGSTIDLIFAGHKIDDSLIVVTGNTFRNIDITTNDEATGRMFVIAAFGTPLIVSGNEFSGLSASYGLGINCIRGSSRNAIISNNIFQDMSYNANGGGTNYEQGLIMMKSDGVYSDSSNAMISGNRARNCQVRSGVFLVGTGSIIGNEFDFTGNYGIDLRPLDTPDSASSVVSKSVVSGNVIRQAGGYIFRAIHGHYDIIGNDIKASDSAIVISTYDTAPDTIDLRFINNTIELDSAFMGGVLVDYGDLIFKQNDITIKNMIKTNYIMFDFSPPGTPTMWLNECRFIGNNFIIENSVNILSLFRADTTNLYLWNNTFINNGQILAYLFYTPKYIELNGNTFDSRLATASHSIIYVGVLPADTILFNNNKMMSGGNISSIIAGGYEITDTLEYAEMIKNTIEANSVVALDTLQNIRVLRLLGNVLKTTNILSGLGTIKNLYQDNNSEVGLVDGQKLSIADQVSSTNDNSITDSTITVTHNLFYTPTVGQIEVKPITTLGSASYFYIPTDSITSTSFKICLNTDAGKVVTLSWKIQDPTLEKLFSSEMCGDPDFTLGTWWAGTAYSSYVSDAMRIDCAEPFTAVFTRDTFGTVGKTYRVTYQIKNYVSGDISPVFGQYSGGTLRNANGTYTDDIYVLPSTPYDEDIFYFATWDSGAELDIDNVSIKEILNP